MDIKARIKQLNKAIDDAEFERDSAEARGQMGLRAAKRARAYELIAIKKELQKRSPKEELTDLEVTRQQRRADNAARTALRKRESGNR